MDKSEIISSLKVLGLDSGADIEEIHAAFRKLARELHPDVTGSKSNYRFQQITGAYTLLKNITPEELAALPAKNIAPKNEKEKIIDGIIEKYEREIKNYYADNSPNDDTEIKAITFRLKSENPKVINAALKHSGKIVNKIEFRKALTEILRRPEIDDDTSEITSSLPFDDVTRKLIALDVADNAKNFPAGLIISLVANDPDVMESFLLHVRPDDAALIMRRWPSGKIMNGRVLNKLLMSDDAKILVPLLGAMKTNFPQSASQHKKRLEDLFAHSSPAVRAWAKKLA